MDAGRHRGETTSGTVPGECFPRAVRVRRRSEFLTIQRRGRRRHTPHFILVLFDRSAPTSRLGVTVSRAVGNAVERNHVKRAVREAFRRMRPHIDPARDVVVIAKPGAAALGAREISREVASGLGVGAG